MDGVQHLRHRLPKTSLQFKQMVDENINMDIAPNKFIQISTFVALKMTETMKQQDNENHKEYIDKRKKLLAKDQKWKLDSAEELKKIDFKKERHSQLLSQIESKRQILKLRMQQIHNKHTVFLQMEKKKNEILKKLKNDKTKLERMLIDKIEKNLDLFDEKFKKLDPVRNEFEYNKLSKKIKICTLKKEVIHSKIESILKTVELTELKSLDLNECHCVFCKGYSPHQYYFGIRQDINGQKYRKEKEEKLKKLAKMRENEIERFINDENESFDEEEDENEDVSNPMHKLSVIEEHSSEEKHDELMNDDDKKKVLIKRRKQKILAKDDDVNVLMKDLKKKRAKMSERDRKNEKCVKPKELIKIRGLKKKKKERRKSTMSLNVDKKKLDKMKKMHMRHHSVSSNNLTKDKHSKRTMIDLEKMMKRNEKSERKSSRIIIRHKRVSDEDENENEEKLVSAEPKSSRRNVKIKRTKSSR